METWRSVPGYEGLYEVSDEGRVRSCARVVQASNRVMNYKEKLLRQNTDSGGYQQVCLCNHTKRKTYGVHTLVLLAFVGPKPEGTEARHYPDPDRSNNRLSNLSWATRSVNSRDKIEHGSHPWLRDGKMNGNPNGYSGHKPKEMVR
ncbi:HNH endonuclease [Gordonia phage RedWattleHog]|nr:HNH endonuclease [Gordonia phage RedWattleHog]